MNSWKLCGLFLVFMGMGLGTSSLFGEFTLPIVPEGWRYYHDLKVGRVGDICLKIELVAPVEKLETKLPVIIYIHGGGWNHGNKDDHAKRIAGVAKRGYVAASIMYRFAPEAVFPAQIEDVQAAIRFLKANAEAYQIDVNKINLWGTSAGAHLASLAGTAANDTEYAKNNMWEDVSVDVLAVVNFAGPTSNFLSPEANRSSSVRAFLGGSPLEKSELALDAMPITHVDSNDPSFFIAHGKSDTTVPVQWSRDFVKALKEAGVPVEYHEPEFGTHQLAKTAPELQELAYVFLDKLNK